MSTEFCNSPYCEHMIFNGSCLCQQLYYDRERIARAKKKEEKNTNLRNPFTTISMIFLPGLTLCPVSPSSLGLLSVSTLNAKWWYHWKKSAKSKVTS